MIQLLFKSRPFYVLAFLAIWVFIFFVPYIGRRYREENVRLQERTVAESILSEDKVDLSKEDKDETVVDYFHAGELSQNGACLDTLDGKNGANIGMWKCHGEGGNQFWFLKKNNALKSKDLCVEGPKDITAISTVSLQKCNENRFQSWEYSEKMIKLAGTQLCLESNQGKTVSLNACNKGVEYQKWSLKAPPGM